MHPLPMATQASKVASTELRSYSFKMYVSPLLKFPSVDSAPKTICRRPAIVRMLGDGVQKGWPGAGRLKLELSDIDESERERSGPSGFRRPANAPIRWDLKKRTAREGEERNGLLQR